MGLVPQVAYVADLQDMCEELQGMQTTMTEQADDASRQAPPLSPWFHFVLKAPFVLQREHRWSEVLCASIARLAPWSASVLCLLIFAAQSSGAAPAAWGGSHLQP